MGVYRRRWGRTGPGPCARRLGRVTGAGRRMALSNDRFRDGRALREFGKARGRPGPDRITSRQRIAKVTRHFPNKGRVAARTGGSGRCTGGESLAKQSVPQENKLLACGSCERPPASHGFCATPIVAMRPARSRRNLQLVRRGLRHRGFEGREGAAPRVERLEAIFLKFRTLDLLLFSLWMDSPLRYLPLPLRFTSCGSFCVLSKFIKVPRQDALVSGANVTPI